MTIRDIIDLLESQGEWVNRNCTRDRILFVLVVVYANCDMYSPVYMGS